MTSSKKTLLMAAMLVISHSSMATGFGFGSNPGGDGGDGGDGGNAAAFGGSPASDSRSESNSDSRSSAKSGSSTGPISVTGAPSSASTGPVTGQLTASIAGGNSSGVGVVNVDASTKIPEVQTFLGGASSPGSNTTAFGRYLESQNFLGIYAYTRMKPDAFTYGMIMMSSTDDAMRVKGRDLMMQGANDVLKPKRTDSTQGENNFMRAGN